jgi:hypothetical protein
MAIDSACLDRLAEMAGREGVPDAEMLRLLIDRAYTANLLRYNPDFFARPPKEEPLPPG